MFAETAPVPPTQLFLWKLHPCHIKRWKQNYRKNPGGEFLVWSRPLLLHQCFRNARWTLEGCPALLEVMQSNALHSGATHSPQKSATVAVSALCRISKANFSFLHLWSEMHFVRLCNCHCSDLLLHGFVFFSLEFCCVPRLFFFPLYGTNIKSVFGYLNVLKNNICPEACWKIPASFPHSWKTECWFGVLQKVT